VRVLYRELFLKDLHKLRGTPFYSKIKDLVFYTLPKCKTIREIPNIKSLKNAENKFRIRVGDYRIGIKLSNDIIEVMRVKHRKEFYRFYP
jgi:mRNA interferase RelE/StbE